MANTRYKGANSSERLTLATLSDNDMFQTRHLPGTVNDADKGVSKALLQALPIAVCATAAATAAKVGTLAPESCPDFSLVNGRTVHVYFSAANTASVPTLNLAGTGALPITYPDGSYVGEWPAGCCLDLMYISIADGNTAIERWVLVSSLPVDEVTLNNMHSVTSNAVAKVRSYATTEHFTGKYYCDGKPIYEKVFLINHPANSTADIDFTVSNNLDCITKVEYITSKITSTGNIWQFFHQGIWGTSLDWAIAYFRLNNGLVMNYGNAYAPYDFVLQVSVEYTKTTD